MRSLVLASALLITTSFTPGSKWTWAQGATPSKAQIEALVTRAKAGDANAQTALGDAYMGGNGVKLDPAKAIGWYKKAAERGNSKSQVSLAVIYEDGIEGLVSVDLASSFNWYRRAAEQGIPQAELEVAEAYASGHGVDRDDVEAAKWMLKAARQREPFAEYAIGSMYETGLGVPQDQAEAITWYRQAAEQNLDFAQYHLGVAYAKGEGIAKDTVGAYFWLNLSAVSYAGARPERDEAAGKLSKEQRSEIQARCRKWYEAHPSQHQLFLQWLEDQKIPKGAR